MTFIRGSQIHSNYFGISWNPFELFRNLSGSLGVPLKDNLMHYRDISKRFETWMLYPWGFQIRKRSRKRFPVNFMHHHTNTGCFESVPDERAASRRGRCRALAGRKVYASGGVAVHAGRCPAARGARHRGTDDQVSIAFVCVCSPLSAW